MKIQKEIENVTRVKDRYPVEPLTMEDAVIFHKKVVDNYEKTRKDLNKELGIGDIEKDGFTGRTDKKFSTAELKKMKLSETLFRNNLIDTDYDDSGKPWSEAKKDIIEKYKKKGFKNIEVIKVKTDTPGLKSYQVFGDKSLTEAKVRPRPNIVNVQGIYDYVVENGFEKEAKEILDDCKIKVIKGKCTEISANANPGNAYYRLSHLVDSKDESLNEKIEDKRVHYKVRNDIRQALADVFYEYYNKYEEDIDQEDFELAIDNFRKHYYPNDESLKEEVDLSEYDNGYVEMRDGKPNFIYNDIRDAYRGMSSSRMGDISNNLGNHTYEIKKWENGQLLDLDESLNENMTQERFDELVETLIKPLVADLDKFQDENGDDFSITWNFGANTNDKITAGLDIRFNSHFRDEETKKIDEEILKPFLTELEEIIDNNGFELDNVNGYDYKTQGPKESIFGDSRHYQIIEK